MALFSSMSADDVDDWFRIGLEESQKKAPTVVAQSALQGNIFNPATGDQYTEEDRKRDHEAKQPKFRRNRQAPTGLDYVTEYRNQNQEELLSNAASISGRDSPSNVSDVMNKLELDTTVCGSSVAFPEELLPEGATDVYKNYKFEHSYAKLPVYSSKEMILSTIESNQVTILQGPTGTGKTTQVPQFILDHYAQESKYCNIVITQPRKIAAVSVAQRVCEERGWDIGSLCGYQVGLDRKGCEDTRILYCTTGVLKEKFINKKNMHEFTHVILDEVHERDIETDFLLLIVMKLLRSNSSHVKIILMSATFDTEVFAKYFAIPMGNRLEPATVITVGSLTHHVSEFFADELSERLGPVPVVDENKPEVSEAMYDMVIGLIKEFDLLEEKEQGKDRRTNAVQCRGSVLIFLPGLHEITTMCSKLKPLEVTHFISPIPLHSSITLFEQKRVFIKPKNGYRKVIISTNIAESSITVPDIKYVIDFCLTKNLCCDPETNYTHLQIEWASKSNTIQRKGRAGRVSNGRAYFMVPRWFYKSLPEYGIPEMQRSPLETLILKTKVFDMGEPKALLALALSPPNLEDIERTILSLKEVGAISSSVGNFANPYDGDLTFVGRVLASLPVDIRLGKMLLLGHVFGVLEECIIIAAALSVKSIFARPFDHRLKAFKVKHGWSQNSMSDCLAILNAYKVWDNRTKDQVFLRAGETEIKWGSTHFIQIKTIHEVHKLVTELTQRLERLNIHVPQQRPSFKMEHIAPSERLILKIVICGAFYPNYAVKEPIDELDAVKILCSNDPRRTVLVRNLPINHGVLYGDQIRNLFRDCWRDPLPAVSFGDSRAFVEFCGKFQGNQEGIHPAVFYAIKMRDLRMPMTIDLLDREESKRKLEELEKSISQDRKGELRTNRLKIGIEDTPSREENLSIGLETSALLVSVTEVDECGHFWGQIDNHINQSLLQRIQEGLNSKPLETLTMKPCVNQMVAAPFVDETECFYRGKIERLSCNPLTAQVFFIDYGNRDQIQVARLKKLPKDIEKEPRVCTEFYLKGITPSAAQCPDGVWNQPATRFFQHMILNKVIYAHVYSVINNTVRVELFDKTPTGQEICVNEELIQRGFADRAEEHYLSVQNHEWREQQHRGEHVSSKVDPWRPVSISGNTQAQKKYTKSRKVTLHGPFSPLEMSFTSTTLSGRQRVVKIDQESVNSVALDDNPQNKFSRLMVAAMISLSSSGSSMIARDTTILPQIPGLLALLALIFTPHAELRTNSKRTKYTGALCGLGYDRDNCPILPDHDMELTFETAFDEDDIGMVNHLRSLLNNSLCTSGRVFPWGMDRTVTDQSNLRQVLEMLLKRRREPVEPEGYRKPYRWNQIHPDHLILNDTAEEESVLFALHQSVEMNQGHPTLESLQWKEYFLKHIEDLKTFVKNRCRTPIICELCQVQALTSQTLEIHIESEKHQRQVQCVNDGTFKPPQRSPFARS